MHVHEAHALRQKAVAFMPRSPTNIQLMACWSTAAKAREYCNRRTGGQTRCASLQYLSPSFVFRKGPKASYNTTRGIGKLYLELDFEPVGQFVEVLRAL